MTFYDYIGSPSMTSEKIQILQLLSMLPEFDCLETPESLCAQIEDHVHELLKSAQDQYKRTEW